MTERLYYEQAYLKEFDAVVLEIQGDRARLDRSAFYPTSGGQPFDTGRIGSARVTDVQVNDGEVWHTFDGSLCVGERVHCEIDWARRFDHMQQHAGEHMIANAVHRFFGGYTIGLHIGLEISTIDVELPDGRMRLTEEDIARVEQDVNAHIQENLPIRCYFPENVDALPLRKRGDVKENVRVVDIGGYELVPCGGTHPGHTGDIGLVKIVDARPSRGKMRLGFLCGGRAFADYQRRYDITERAANALSTNADNLPALVEQMSERIKALEYELRQANTRRLLESADAMEREKIQGFTLVAGKLDAQIDALRALASKLIEAENTFALLQTEDGKLLFAKNAAPVHMGKLLSQVGKGGGKPDFAQGVAGDADALEKAKCLLRQKIDEEMRAL